ncbi:unnamed protein product [Camellia sinensis]
MATVLDRVKAFMIEVHIRERRVGGSNFITITFYMYVCWNINVAGAYILHFIILVIILDVRC